MSDIERLIEAIENLTAAVETIGSDVEDLLMVVRMLSVQQCGEDASDAKQH